MNRTIAVIGCFFIWAAAGCQQRMPQAVSTEPPSIPVAKPLMLDVTDYVDYTGRTDAINPESIRPQITGKLEKTHFREGSFVKAGELLFEIDPTLYQAQFDLAQATLDGNKAALKQAEEQRQIDQQLVESKAVSRLTVDKDSAAVDEAKARIKGAEATLKSAQTILDYTRITSPIDGVVSRYNFTPGNIVNANQTLLTTVVSMDPIYGYFDMDARTYHRYKTLINENKINLPQKDDIEQLRKNEAPAPVKAPGEKGKSYIVPNSKVLMETESEQGFPHQGQIDFINNQINSSTGTIAVRGIFKNTRPKVPVLGADGKPVLGADGKPEEKDGEWPLVPGDFVRFRLPMGEPHRAMLVIDRAIQSDQGLKYVFVAETGPNKDGVVDTRAKYRRVYTGALHEGGLRVIEPFKEETDEKQNKIKTGVQENELVVVGGLPQIRSNAVITPKEQEMPRLGATDVSTPVVRPQGGEPAGKGKK